MRIAICTPVDRRSAIAAVTLAIAESLADRHDVTVHATTCTDPLGTTVEVQWIGPETALALRASDAVVHVLGDHSGYHGQILDLVTTVPGVLIVHDVSLANLLAGHYGLQHYLRVVDAMHGPEARRATAHAWAQAGDGRMDGWFAAAVAYPIEAPVIAEGLAVVVHSAGAALRFGPFVPGGATVLPLPFVGQHAASPVPGEARRRLDVPDQRVLVSCIGILNASRRIDLLIDAVAREDLGERLFLLVAGMAGRETEATIRAHADRAGLTADNFRIETGWLPPRRYADVLAATDLFANLRSDHAASGSATVLEQMWASKPVIVLDQGPFRDLPDDAVVKVSPRFAAAELHGHLGRLALDTGTRRRIGERARTHVERHHPVEHYASALVEVLREADRGHARNEIEHQVVDNLERAGVRPDTPAMGAISETMNELFGWSDPPAGVGPVDARHDR